MKYTAKDKQDLDGVRTLANDALVACQIVGGGSKKIKHPKKKS